MTTAIEEPSLGETSSVVAQDAVAAGAVAALVSGAPSTLYALLTDGDPIEAALAAGTIILPGEHRRGRLLVAATAVHVSLSLGWAIVLAKALPRRRTVAAAAVAGLGIAALDLGVIGRHFPRIRALPLMPQLADHVAYAGTVGAILARRRAQRSAHL